MVGSGEFTVPEVITALLEEFLKQNSDEAGQDVPER